MKEKKNKRIKNKRKINFSFISAMISENSKIFSSTKYFIGLYNMEKDLKAQSGSINYVEIMCKSRYVLYMLQF